MSDSLKEKLMPGEDDVTQFEDAFIITTVSFVNCKLLVGSLVGVSFEDTGLKIDVKVSLTDAHDIIGELATQQAHQVDAIEFHYKTIKQINNLYYVSVARISEIDHSNKMAILALDLVKAA